MSLGTWHTYEYDHRWDAGTHLYVVIRRGGFDNGRRLAWHDFAVLTKGSDHYDVARVVDALNAASQQAEAP